MLLLRQIRGRKPSLFFALKIPVAGLAQIKVEDGFYGNDRLGKIMRYRLIRMCQ
jgi:hypothetical protein